MGGERRAKPPLQERGWETNTPFGKIAQLCPGSGRRFGWTQEFGFTTSQPIPHAGDAPPILTSLLGQSVNHLLSIGGQGPRGGRS